MLLSGKSLKHDFIRFVSATMASQVVFSLYSMVDGLMVSIGVNEYAMSAVNLAIPFTNALFSIAVLFAVGSSTLIAIFIAQEKRREANALFSEFCHAADPWRGHHCARAALFGAVCVPSRRRRDHT